MTRTDALAITSGLLAGLVATLTYLHREQAKAFVEYARMDSTTPESVAAGIQHWKDKR
jgi:hypothetical protein